MSARENAACLHFFVPDPWKTKTEVCLYCPARRPAIVVFDAGEDRAPPFGRDEAVDGPIAFGPPPPVAAPSRIRGRVLIVRPRPGRGPAAGTRRS